MGLALVQYVQFPLSKVDEGKLSFVHCVLLGPFASRLERDLVKSEVGLSPGSSGSLDLRSLTSTKCSSLSQRAFQQRWTVAQW